MSKFAFIVILYSYMGADVEAEQFVIAHNLTQEECATKILVGLREITLYDGKTLNIEDKPVSFVCEYESSME